MAEETPGESPQAAARIKRCWIHVGMHKTGSSSIQKTLAALGKGPDWKLLSVDKNPNLGKAMYAMFGKNPENFIWFAKRGETAEQLAKKRELMRRRFELLIRKSPEENLILSTETLSIMASEEVAALKEFLTPLFDEIKVIGYVRPPSAFKTSWFQQLVKHGEDKLDPNRIKASYRKRFGKFDRIFGKAHVSLKLFDPAGFPNNCIVTDFLTRIGVAPLPPEKILRVNDGMCREACAILFAYRKLGPGYGVGKTVVTENNKLIAPLLEMKGTRLRLAPELLAQSLSNEWEDIAWMERRLKTSFRETHESDGSQVRSEDDLLTIPRAACLDYLRKFHEVHGIEVSEDIVPSADPVPPAEVAAMVEHCRDLIRNADAPEPAAEDDAGAEAPKRLWIHIGMHKTGTSSIQANLARIGKGEGWRYLKLDGANMGKSLHAMFGTNPANFHLYVKAGDTPEEIARRGATLRRKLELMIRRSGRDTLIISSEMLSNMSAEEVTAFRDFLAPLVDEIRIIGYVRPPSGFAVSWFQQAVKQGSGELDLAKLKPNYRKRFEKFDRIFGRDRVKLCFFDPAALTRGCIIADFCEQTGIHPPDPGSITRVNESLGREACAILFAYRKLGPGFGVGPDVLTENNRLIRPLIAMGGTKLRFSQSLLDQLCQRNLKDIEWMEKRIRMSLREEVQSDGSEVGDESDLLNIRNQDCAEFLAKFQEVLGIETTPDLLPSADPVDPADVSAMVERCREQIRSQIAAERSIASADPDAKPLKCLWLHIGMHKTGTSSIQANLSQVKDPQGWRYLKLDGPNMGRSLHAMFGKDPQNFHLYAKAGDSAEEIARRGAALRRKLELMIRRSGDDTLILSSEMLSNMSKEEITAVRDFLAPLVDRIQVIGYVRPPGGFAVSWFQQAVKQGSGELNLEKLKPNYRRRFAKFDEVFGKSAVKLRIFDPATLAKGCIVADFCGHTGIQPPAPESIVRVNESLSREACSLLVAYRKYGPGFGVGPTVLTENTRLIRPLIAMQGSKLQFSQSLLDEIRTRHLKDIAWMEKRLQLSLREEIRPLGTEVNGEEDLLDIRRVDCTNFLKQFRDVLGLNPTDDLLPTSDPVPPLKAAAMVESCRALIRRDILENSESAEEVPMKCLWLHIGMHETACTTLRDSLTRSPLPANWRILNTGGKPNMGQALQAMFGEKPESYVWFARRGETAEQLAARRIELRKDFENEIRSSTESNLIVSSETLSIMTAGEISALHEFLKPMIDDIRVLAYVRPPESFLGAWFERQVRMGTGDFQASSVKTSYQFRLRKFDTIFGREKVELRLFDPALFPNRDVVADFKAVVGLPALETPSAIEAETPMSREALGMLFAYRKFGPGYGVGRSVVEENNRLIQAALALKGPPVRFAATWIEQALESQAKDIAWVEKRLGMSVKESPPTEGSEIADESSLLSIRMSTCWDFADQCRSLFGIRVTPAFPRSAEIVPPQQVAALVEQCREAIRETLEPSGMVRRLKRFVARKRRALGTLLASPSESSAAKRSPKKPSSPKQGRVSEDDGAVR